MWLIVCLGNDHSVLRYKNTAYVIIIKCIISLYYVSFQRYHYIKSNIWTKIYLYQQQRQHQSTYSVYSHKVKFEVNKVTQFTTVLKIR